MLYIQQTCNKHNLALSTHLQILQFLLAGKKNKTILIMHQRWFWLLDLQIRSGWCDVRCIHTHPKQATILTATGGLMRKRGAQHSTGDRSERDLPARRMPDWELEQCRRPRCLTLAHPQSAITAATHAGRHKDRTWDAQRLWDLLLRRSKPGARMLARSLTVSL